MADTLEAPARSSTEMVGVYFTAPRYVRDGIAALARLDDRSARSYWRELGTSHVAAAASLVESLADGAAVRD